MFRKQGKESNDGGHFICDIASLRVEIKDFLRQNVIDGIKKS